MCDCDIYSDESLSSLTPEQLLELIKFHTESIEKWEKMKKAPYFEGGGFTKTVFTYES